MTSERVAPILSWPCPKGLESQASSKGVGPKKACGKPWVRCGSMVDGLLGMVSLGFSESRGVPRRQIRAEGSAAQVFRRLSMA